MWSDPPHQKTVQKWDDSTDTAGTEKRCSELHRHKVSSQLFCFFFWVCFDFVKVLVFLLHSLRLWKSTKHLFTRSLKILGTLSVCLTSIVFSTQSMAFTEHGYYLECSTFLKWFGKLWSIIQYTSGQCPVAGQWKPTELIFNSVCQLLDLWGVGIKVVWLGRREGSMQSIDTHCKFPTGRPIRRFYCTPQWAEVCSDSESLFKSNPWE